mgnify:CR=1 FL=1
MENLSVLEKKLALNNDETIYIELDNKRLQINGHAYQDLFVLFANNFKQNGYFIEIGSAWPRHTNNTYILEKEFRKRVRYDIIEKMGNYYYFQTTSMTYSPGMYVGGGVGGGGMMMGGGASKTVQQMYFDFATGTEELLTKSKLKKNI